MLFWTKHFLRSHLCLPMFTFTNVKGAFFLRFCSPQIAFLWLNTSLAHLVSWVLSNPSRAWSCFTSMCLTTPWWLYGTSSPSRNKGAPSETAAPTAMWQCKEGRVATLFTFLKSLKQILKAFCSRGSSVLLLQGKNRYSSASYTYTLPLGKGLQPMIKPQQRQLLPPLSTYVGTAVRALDAFSV